jgi:hypothetical protein
MAIVVVNEFEKNKNHPGLEDYAHAAMRHATRTLNMSEFDPHELPWSLDLPSEWLQHLFKADTSRETSGQMTPSHSAKEEALVSSTVVSRASSEHSADGDATCASAAHSRMDSGSVSTAPAHDAPTLPPSPAVVSKQSSRRKRQKRAPSSQQSSKESPPDPRFHYTSAHAATHYAAATFAVAAAAAAAAAATATPAAAAAATPAATDPMVPAAAMSSQHLMNDARWLIHPPSTDDLRYTADTLYIKILMHEHSLDPTNETLTAALFDRIKLTFAGMMPLDPHDPLMRDMVNAFAARDVAVCWNIIQAAPYSIDDDHAFEEWANFLHV